MAGLQTNEFDTLYSQFRKERKREPSEDEEAALNLMMLSQDNRSWHIGTATTSAAATEIVEDVNPVATTVTTTSERTAALASADDNKKSMKPFFPTIIASPLNQNISYICSVCSKSFSSYQALGGHKTSHRDRSKFATTTATTSTINISYLNPSDRIHECNICNKIFTTGQALGGHMRLHYEDVIKGRKKTSLIASKGGASSQRNSNGSTTDDFNLNLPAFSETYLDITYYPKERTHVLDDQQKVEIHNPFKKQRLDE